jgi:XTP/dITP diphosphohydrolase
LGLALIVGTKNRGKLVEIQRLFSGLELDLLPLTDIPEAPDVEEDGQTFLANAVKKAQAIVRWSGRLTLAEDSGLEVAALGGRPGVYTARFGGPGLSSHQRCRYLLEQMRDVPATARQATFRCVAVLADPAGPMLVRDGQCPGVIGYELRGEHGFGYDPIFIIPQLGRTLAELSAEEKERVSHRAQAMRALIPVLTALAQGCTWDEACQIPETSRQNP